MHVYCVCRALGLPKTNFTYGISTKTNYTHYVSEIIFDLGYISSRIERCVKYSVKTLHRGEKNGLLENPKQI